MAKYINNELMRKIEEKNLLLRSLSHGGSPDSKRVQHIKAELDRLLYTYYKSLK